MARRGGLLGWLFGGSRRRSSSARRSKAPRPKQAPKAKAPKAPKQAPYRGAATAKTSSARYRQQLANAKAARRPPPRLWSEKYTKEVLAGKHGIEKLQQLLSGARTARRNPGHLADLRRLAERQSQTFHGKGFRDVVELNGAEQRRYGLPRWVVPIGRKNAIEYVPPSGSARAGNIWRHRAGDRGRGKAEARRVGMLVADPRNGRSVEIGGSEKFRPGHGLVG